MRPYVTQTRLVSSVAYILDAEPLRFRITLAMHRVHRPERRDASKPAGRIVEGFWKEEMLERGNFVTQGLRAPGRLWKRLDPVQCGKRAWHSRMQRTEFHGLYLFTEVIEQGQTPLHPSLLVVVWPWPSSFESLSSQ